MTLTEQDRKAIREMVMIIAGCIGILSAVMLWLWLVLVIYKHVGIP